MREKCARFPRLRGRLITFSSGLRIHFDQVDMRVRYLGMGKNASGARLSVVLGPRCLFENGNSKKFSQYFLSKLSFDKLSWAFCILPSKIFWIFSHSGFSSLSVSFHGISNQFCIWFGFREKVEYLG